MPAIIAEDGLSRKYIIRHQHTEPDTALHELVADGVPRTAGRLLHHGRQVDDTETGCVLGCQAQHPAWRTLQVDGILFRTR